MIKELKNLGFSDKESRIYLALIELGLQPASVVAKRVKIPKSTTLFILENLCKEGFIRKSIRGKTHYFLAEPADLKNTIENRIKKHNLSLSTVIPLLETVQRPFSSRPQTTFFEGIDNCKTAYLQLLNVHGEIMEFGSHTDLEEAFGKTFMADFIKKRIKKKIPLRAISSNAPKHKELAKFDKQHLRENIILKDFMGEINSSIAIFDNKILILNLKQSAFGILIENPDMFETLRTMFELSWIGSQK